MPRLEVEADARASFVQHKENRPWLWPAMEVKSRQIIAFHVGDRSRRSAKQLSAKIPEACRQRATFDADQSVVYDGVIPEAQYKAISKLAYRNL